MSKLDDVKLFRENGFNCFPIKRYADSIKEQKAADHRYKAADTESNQIITETDNYGVIASAPGSCMLDLDDKEYFRSFAEENIVNGHMVTETPNGWHIPMINFSGQVQKIMLWNKAQSPDKQLVDIQGPKHYVIGPGCDVFDEKKQTRVFYESRGSMKIFDAQGKNFDDFVDSFSKKFNVRPKTVERSANYSMRKRFKEGKIPTPGTSNLYFFNAGLVCHSTELDLPIEEAFEKVREIYELWKTSETFTGRTWENIENKIRDAYDMEPLHEGRPKKGEEKNFALELAKNLVESRNIYSDQKTDEIFENKSGYLENITLTLHKEIQQIHNDLSQADFKDFIFKVVGLADDVPETHKNLKVFDNGVFDSIQHKIIQTDKLADMGFKGYNYLADVKEPEKFIDIVFGNVPEHEHPRLNAALKSALNPKLDPRITVIHGLAGVGKSIGMTILCKILCKYEQYAIPMELSQLLTDKFIKAKIKGKTLLVISELPETYTDFAAIKALTGEEVKTERGFYADASTFDNKLKIIGTTNYLAKIPEKEKNAMYSRRLSLIHNIQQVAYKHDDEMADRIIEAEGEQIISWILNIPDKECEYEPSSIVQAEWEGLSSPELEYMQKNWRPGESSAPIALVTLKQDFEAKYQVVMPLKTFTNSLKEQGYSVYRNQVDNIIPVIQKETPNQTIV